LLIPGSIAVGNKRPDIDHLVIGPAGVFSLNAKRHKEAKISVAGDVSMVNGRRQFYCRQSSEQNSPLIRTSSSASQFAQISHGGDTSVTARHATT
jgi:hypothetical protein